MCNNEPSLVFWQLQAFYRVSYPYLVFNFPYWFEILNPCFVTNNNICKLSLIGFWKHFKQLLRVFTRNRFLKSSVNKRNIHLTDKYWYFQNTLWNEMYPRKLYAISFGNIKKCVSVITIKLFLTFETFVMPFTVTDRPDFVATLTDFVPPVVLAVFFQLQIFS